MKLTRSPARQTDFTMGLPLAKQPSHFVCKATLVVSIERSNRNVGRIRRQLFNVDGDDGLAQGSARWIPYRVIADEELFDPSAEVLKRAKRKHTTLLMVLHIFSWLFFALECVWGQLGKTCACWIARHVAWVLHGYGLINKLHKRVPRRAITWRLKRLIIKFTIAKKTKK